MNIVEELIHRIYEKYAQRGETRQPYMYCGPNTKSFYFFSCISLYYIKKHGYQIPIFIKTMKPKHMLKFNSPLIIIDDAAYSASQLASMVQDIYQSRLKEGLPPIDVTMALTALNTIALNRLSKVANRFSNIGVSKVELEHVLSPYDLIYLPERLYTALPIKLGIERYFYLNLFFNPCLSSSTNIALYLDHKVADSVSTYKNVYVYGPIVPYDYKNDIIISRDTGIICQTVNTSYFSEDEINSLIIKFVQENPDFLQIMPNALSRYSGEHESKLRYFLHEKALERDKYIDRPIYETGYKKGIQFYPFIQKCSKSNKLKEIINNPEIKNMQYFIFTHDEGPGVGDIRDYGYVLRGHKNERHRDRKLQDEEELYNEPITQEALRLVALLKSHRCPTPFYKKGILQLI